MRISIVIFFLFLIFGTRYLLAENTGSDVSGRITRLIGQVDELEKKQQQILLTENKLIEEIKNLKIQARH